MNLFKVFNITDPVYLKHFLGVQDISMTSV